MHNIRQVILLVLTSTLWSCNSKIDQGEMKGLKDFYQDYFPMGVAVYPEALDPGPESELIKEHFVSMTPENVMKMGPIHPQEDSFNWAKLASREIKRNELRIEH